MADGGDAADATRALRHIATAISSRLPLVLFAHVLTAALSPWVMAETDGTEGAPGWRHAGAVVRSYSSQSALAFAADCPGASKAGSSSGDAEYWDWEDALFTEALAQRLQLHSRQLDNAGGGTGGSTSTPAVAGRGAGADGAERNGTRGNDYSLPAVTGSAAWARPHYCMDASATYSEKGREYTEEEDKRLMRTCYDSATKRRIPCSIAESDSGLQDAIIKKVWCYLEPVCAARDYFDKDAEQRLVAKIITEAEYEI